MRNGFENYKAELDALRLTEESKRALAKSLARRGRTRAGRRSLTLRRTLTAAAVLCLLAAMTVGAVAQVAGDPALRDTVSGDSAGYDQSSGVIGRSVECGGWTVTITDCLGDESYCYIGVEVEAPEGTVLDGDYYLMNAEFDSNMLHKGNGGGWDSLLRPLPDDDPTDNRVRMVYGWSARGAGLSGAQVRLKLTNFYEEFNYNWEERDWNKEYLSEGTWDFGWMTVDFADNVRHIPLAEDIPIPGGDGLLLVDEVVVSPLGVTFHFANKPWSSDWYEDWFAPMLEETLAVLDTDGNPIPLNIVHSGQDMDAGKDYRDYGEGAIYAGWTCHCRFGLGPDYAAEHYRDDITVIDMDRIASLTVGGVTIPLQ